MKRLYFFTFLFVVIMLFSPLVYGQTSERGFEMGLAVGGAFGLTESEDMPFNPLTRFYITGHLMNKIRADFGLGFGIIGGDDYETYLLPIALRLRYYPFNSETLLPYIYFGGGALFYDCQDLPPNWSYTEADLTDSTPFLLLGLGLEFRFTDYLALDLNGGIGYSFSDDLNPIIIDNNDSYLGGLAGLTFAPGNLNPDPDNDGLMTKEEKGIGTDHKNPDTDGDGLSDGGEITMYKTNPLKADTDGDGLDDKAEVQVHGTDPNVADSDGDGLDDRAEIMDYKTDPAEPDTDGDNLSDYEEIFTYSTNPLNVDTDGDDLQDFDEVGLFNSDPLMIDTDGGGLNDFDEFIKDKDPRNADDDVEEEVLAAEVGVPIVLDGVVFGSGSDAIEPESEAILMEALHTLEAYPDMVVEVHGYTDNTGNRDFNMMLSQKRAEAVKVWLIENGIAEERLIAKGFGPENPIAPNDTREGRRKNRRIEFIRVE